MFKLSEIRKMLNAQVLFGEDLLDEIIVYSCCGADLLSDVLAFCKEKTLLLTGTTNLQVIRTVEISDLSGVIFVRGKKPNKEVIQAAKEQNIPVLVTEHTMYEACGILYMQGLPGCPQKEEVMSDA